MTDDLPFHLSSAPKDGRQSLFGQALTTEYWGSVHPRRPEWRHLAPTLKSRTLTELALGPRECQGLGAEKARLSAPLLLCGQENHGVRRRRL